MGGVKIICHKSENRMPLNMVNISNPHREDWTVNKLFDARANSRLELQDFNDKTFVPVELSSLNSAESSIRLSGIKGEGSILWNFSSVDTCLKKPKPNIDWIHIQFILNGMVNFKCFSGNVVGDKDVAILARFDDLRTFEASKSFSSIGLAFAPRTLIELNRNLMGSDDQNFPELSLSCPISRPGIKALLRAMTTSYQKYKNNDIEFDYTYSLLQEIMGYQLLASWPTENNRLFNSGQSFGLDRLNLAIEYIHDNISSPMMLSDIAAASRMSVRSLQSAFRRSIDQTPSQYIINKRLMLVHQDLLDKQKNDMSIISIAKKWGFVHASDFGQRYRLLFGCTPTETRRANM